MEKIKELTEKLRQEGVEAGRAQASEIVEAAKKEAAEIVKAAKEQAAAIEAQAKRRASETDTNTKNELKLYTGQALNALKSEIANVVTAKVASKAAETLTEDKALLGRIAVTLASKWAEGESIVLATEDAKALTAYFEKEAKQLLSKGVTIKKVNNSEAAFTIEPEDGAYRVRFGKEEFENYFKAFLRPGLVEMLF